MTKHTRTAAFLVATAAVGIALAPVAVADTQMSGHYTETTTNRESGQTITNHWFFTPCGDGCATVQLCDNTKRENCENAKAQLSDGRWKMDVSDIDVGCPDGSVIPKAARFHYEWNPSSLAGTGEGTREGPGCPGLITPVAATTDIQLKLV